MIGKMGLVDRVAALHRVDLFAATPGRVLVAVARAADEDVVEPGGSLIVEGVVEHHMFAIVEGRVQVLRSGQVFSELGPGSTVGELAVLVPEPRSASVVAIDRTIVLRIDKSVLDELLADWPELASGVIAALVARLRTTARFVGTGSE